MRSKIARDSDIPVAPFFGSRVIEGLPLEPVFAHINPTALFRVQWQFKRGQRTKEEFEREIEDKAQPIFERLRERSLNDKIVSP